MAVKIKLTRLGKIRNPQYRIDRSYIMAAMCLLGEEYPDVAVRMMKKYIRVFIPKRKKN